MLLILCVVIGWKRAVFSAQIKVMKRRQLDEEKLEYQKHTQNKNERDVVPGLLSMHGIFRIPCGTPLDDSSLCMTANTTTNKDDTYTGLAIVEACPGSIVIRRLRNLKDIGMKSLLTTYNDQTIDHIHINGFFNSKDVLFLTTIMSLCKKYKLQPTPLVTPGSVSMETKILIQTQKAETHVLPAGVYYDGSGYWSSSGISSATSRLRPDIDDLVLDYCEEKNIEIEKFNSMIQAVQQYL